MKQVVVGTGILAVLLVVAMLCSGSVRTAAQEVGQLVAQAEYLPAERAQETARKALSVWRQYLPALRLSKQHDELQTVLLELQELADAKDEESFGVLCHRILAELDMMEREERLWAENIF